MKSLEIVNEMLNYPFEERILTELATNETIIREEELKKIKADLEVLEIIKKKRVNVGDLAHVFRICDSDEECLEFYNAYIKNKTRLTLEELLKIKQWLEENENEICN